MMQRQDNDYGTPNPDAGDKMRGILEHLPATKVPEELPQPITHPWQSRLLLRLPEAGRLTGYSRSTTYELANTEWRSFVITVGRSKRIIYAGLIEWIERKREEAAGVGDQTAARETKSKEARDAH
jgi:predicted DNA-binding transcriptional regulator AlpA